MNKTLLLLCATAFLMGPVLNACCSAATNNCMVGDTAFTVANPNGNLSFTQTCMALPQNYGSAEGDFCKNALANNNNCTCVDIATVKSASQALRVAMRLRHKNFINALKEVRDNMSTQLYKDSVNEIKTAIQNNANMLPANKTKLIAFYDELLSGAVRNHLNEYIDNVKPCLQQLFTIKHNIFCGLCTDKASDFVSNNGYTVNKEVCRDLVPHCAKAHLGLFKYLRATFAKLYGLLPNYVPLNIDEPVADLVTCADNPTTCKDNAALVDRLCPKLLPGAPPLYSPSSPARILEFHSEEHHARVLSILEPLHRILSTSPSGSETAVSSSSSSTAYNAQISSPNNSGIVPGDPDSQANFTTTPESPPTNSQNNVTSGNTVLASLMALLVLAFALLN